MPLFAISMRESFGARVMGAAFGTCRDDIAARNGTWPSVQIHPIRVPGLFPLEMASYPEGYSSHPSFRSSTAFLSCESYQADFSSIYDQV